MLNQARYYIIQQLHSTHHNRLWGGCLANMAAHHWTRILKLYHVSCCILRFSFVPNNIIMHVPGRSLVEPHNSLSFVSYITHNLGSPNSIGYVHKPVLLSPITSSNSETKRPNKFTLYTHSKTFNIWKLHSIRSIPDLSIDCLAFQGSGSELFALPTNTYFDNHKNHNWYNDQNHPRRFNLGGFSIHHETPHVSLICVNFCFNFWQFHRMGGGGMDSGHLLSKTISKSFQNTFKIQTMKVSSPKEVLCSAAACTWPRVLLQHFHKTSSVIMFSFEWQTFAPGWNTNINQEHAVAEFFFCILNRQIIWEILFIGKFRHFST